MASATDRRLRLALVGVFAVSVWAASEAARYSPRSTTWLLGGALASCAALGWWVLRRAGAEIAGLSARGQALQARLASHSAAQQRFLRRFAHQIKTPLTIVVTQTELIRRRSGDPAAVEDQARGIVGYLLHVSALIDGLLRLGSPTSPADTSEHVPVPIHDLVVDAVRRSQSIARSCGVELVTSLSVPESGRDAPEVLGDRALMEAMLEGLLRQAVHVTPRGSRVDLRVRTEGDAVVLVVRDTGPAIAAADIDAALESFFEARSTTREGSEPIMGLAIARLIAEHHGGSISFRNHPDGGGEVEVRLPRHEVGRRPAAVDGAVGPPADRHPVGAGQQYLGEGLS